MAQIVVVEDDVYMHEELIDVLRKAGYDAVPLLNFENAVSQIMALSPDLILLDINLPFHSGFEVCKDIKPKRLGTVLILTARDKLQDEVHALAHHLRTQLEYVNEQQLKITDYESYIENWVHEIKKPLSLMTLLLDNRKDEMSPLVHTRMLYVRDHIRQNVEQILYFSRLGAAHKDYYFEPLPILETCKEAVEDNLSLLEEAHFSVTYSGNNCTAISDKKGFMFILGQIISNSVKYATHDATPAIHFSVSDNKEIGQIVLSICDNGTGIPASDLPFVFDKGFTGDVGSYLSRSTGMGLYLVQQMASDLTIKVDIHSNTNGGTTVILTFPKVERPLGR